MWVFSFKNPVLIRPFFWRRTICSLTVLCPHLLFRCVTFHGIMTGQLLTSPRYSYNRILVWVTRQRFCNGQCYRYTAEVGRPDDQGHRNLVSFHFLSVLQQPFWLLAYIPSIRRVGWKFNWDVWMMGGIKEIKTNPCRHFVVTFCNELLSR